MLRTSLVKATLLASCLGLLGWTSLQIFPQKQDPPALDTDWYWTDGTTECILVQQYRQVVCYPVETTQQT